MIFDNSQSLRHPDNEYDYFYSLSLLKADSVRRNHEIARTVKSYRKVKLQFWFNRITKAWVLDRNASAYFIL